MAKKIHQIRYYGDKNSKNYPAGLTAASLAQGLAFSQYLPIVQLGIQTLPGMKVYINSHDKPVVIGQTGIYELSVDGMSYITNLAFDPITLSLINKNQTNTYLIVDFLYETEGE